MPLELSSKCQYVLLAMVELATFYTSGERLQIRQIATRQNIPERYLEQLLLTLKQNGLVKSVRGPNGGYQLARDPQSITLLDIVLCMEGNQGCEGASFNGAPTVEGTVIQSVWKKAQEAADAVLGACTLQMLIDERDSKNQAASMYYI